MSTTVLEKAVTTAPKPAATLVIEMTSDLASHRDAMLAFIMREADAEAAREAARGSKVEEATAVLRCIGAIDSEGRWAGLPAWQNTKKKDPRASYGDIALRLVPNPDGLAFTNASAQAFKSGALSPEEMAYSRLVMNVRDSLSYAARKVPGYRLSTGETVEEAAERKARASQGPKTTATFADGLAFTVGFLRQCAESDEWQGTPDDAQGLADACRAYLRSVEPIVPPVARPAARKRATAPKVGNSR